MTSGWYSTELTHNAREIDKDWDEEISQGQVHNQKVSYRLQTLIMYKQMCYEILSMKYRALIYNFRIPFALQHWWDICFRYDMKLKLVAFKYKIEKHTSIYGD